MKGHSGAVPVLPSSGSSAHEPLSQARHGRQLLAPGAWQLHAWRWTFRPFLSPEWAQAPRLPKTLPPPALMPFRVPAPRQPIPRIPRGLCFLGHPPPSGLAAWSPAPVSGRAPDGFPRSGCPFSPFSPSHSAVCSPGTQRRVMRSLLCQEVRGW